MKTIAVSNYKGGVAKTTTAVNVAYNMAEKGNRVLLVDADPQGNASYMIWKYSPSAKTLVDGIENGKFANVIVRRSRFKNLDIIPATAELEKLNKRDDYFMLRLFLGDVENKYDYCIIDCQPTMQYLTKSALVAADLAVVPFKAEGYSINGLELMSDFFTEINGYRQEIGQKELDYRCLVTMFKQNRKNLDRVIGLIEKSEYPVFDTVISFSQACDSSVDARKPLSMHRSKASATEDYRKLSEDVLNVLEGGEYNA